MAGTFRCAVDGDFGSGGSHPSGSGLPPAGLIGTPGFATPEDLAGVMAAEGFGNLDWCGYGAAHGNAAFHLSLDLGGAASAPAVSLSFDLSAGAADGFFLNGGFGEPPNPKGAAPAAAEAGATLADSLGRRAGRRLPVQRDLGRFALRRSDRRGRQPAHRRPG